MRILPVRLVASAAVAFALVAVPEAGFGQVIPKPRPAVTEGKATVKPDKKVAKAETTAKVDRGSVYLLRGLANIFSLGMNTLGEELEKRGVETVVTNHSHGFEIVDKLAKQYEKDKSILPIILIGHSLGGNKTLSMAERLAEKNVPVRLIVIFDATVARPVPLNVKEVLNLYKSKSVGKVVAGAPGYKGVIDNQDVSDIPGVGHISIDKSKQLHAEVIEKVLAVLSEDQAPKKQAPKKKPVVIEQPVAKAPDVMPPETTPPAAKMPDVTETKTPEAAETKASDTGETKPPEGSETKTPEVTETKAPEATDKTPESAGTKTSGGTLPPPATPEGAPTTPAPAATN